MALPLILVLVLALAWSIWWYVVFTTVKSTYAEEENRLAAQGATISCSGQNWGGYPFRVEMTCEAPSFALDRGGIATVLKSANFAALLQAYNPTHVVALLDGPSTLSLPGEEPREIGHGRATASVRPLEDNRLQISAQFPDLAVPGIGTANTLTLHLRSGQAGEAQAAAVAEAASVILPTGASVPIDRADLQIKLPVELIAGGDPLHAAAETGAILIVERLDIVQEGLTLSASGTLSLDPQGRVNGKLTTSVSDLDLLRQRLTTQLSLNENDAAALATMLGIMKSAGSRLDLVARDGRLFWGLVRLAEIPPLLPPTH